MAEKMSIHRALKALKTLEKRIDKNMKSTKYVNYIVGEKGGIQGYDKVEEYKEEAKDNMKSIEDLINRRKVIKSKITEANAKNVVKIAGEKMTVADAIERKNSIRFEESLLEELRMQYYNIVRAMDRTEEKNEETLKQRIQAAYGGEKQVSKEDAAVISDNFWKDHKPSMVDPVNIREGIKTLDEYIDSFNEEVDAVLNESNAKEEITIED